ncbi:hypothetical protein J3R30DRAFT_417927 [Lentinula aciculospora]|uniref:Uncharacterized protein n=1 Tax=Lentinula aciculospora TaxID=153920 RepID=A0A9W9A8K0_9AGAR|nr:hypothetical protein J3R30DRAFT_417927 [Lentinula aciculospora]
MLETKNFSKFPSSTPYKIITISVCGIFLTFDLAELKGKLDTAPVSDRIISQSESSTNSNRPVMFFVVMSCLLQLCLSNIAIFFCLHSVLSM